MQTDVLIIGGGLTGIVAADEIIQHSDLEVLQLSCGGGASPYIHAFCLPIGEGDSEELFYKDTIDSGYGQCDPALAHRLCADSSNLSEYFCELGLDIDRSENGPNLLHSLGSTVPRIAGIQNNSGPVMLKTLQNRLDQSKRYKKLMGYRALELVCDGDRVIGAKCFDTNENVFYTIYARTVILASGGFGRLFPESTNSKDIGGDGIAMAYRAGATLTDMEFIQFEPSAAVWPPQVAGKGIVTTMFYEGAVLRGKNGNRFMLDYSEAGECVPKDVQSKCIYNEMRNNGTSPHGGVWFDATKVPEEKWQGVYAPYLNRYLACGIDLRQEPVEIAPAAHTTCGGVRIDENCLCGIVGLVVCGEVAGGVHGANRLGGNAGLETMVFGRIAGKTAIEKTDKNCALPKDIPAFSNIESDIDVAIMREKLSSVLRDSLNVVRDKVRLECGINSVREMLSTIGNFEGCFEKHRLYNDLLTAYITLISALERTSNVGCHYRADSVKEADKYRIEIKKNGEGIDVHRKPV